MFNILVVDDDKNIRYVMKEILQTAKYNVFTAINGEDAFDVLVKEHIDLAIVDIMMPCMDGYEFTKELRSFNSEMPILMVSAKQLPEDRKKGFVVGIDDFMTKPIDTEELLLHVKALLRRLKIVSERKLTVGKVVLDYDSFTVERQGEVHELPQKEFMLLYKLLSFPNKIFTRIQLMDEIWGVDCETGSETVTVHVGRLRKRFEHWDDFEIEAIRGLGYKAVKK
ncbi:MAG: response regulator transcription factor [Clostridia bacterium]|nr:response regulator transcription factor [Clostridia bacterium]